MLSVQRENGTYSHREVLNAMLYVLVNGGKWRQLPKLYDKLNVIFLAFVFFALIGEALR